MIKDPVHVVVIIPGGILTGIGHIHAVCGIGKKDSDVVWIRRIELKLGLGDKSAPVPIEIEEVVCLAPLSLIVAPATKLPWIRVVSVTKLDLVASCLECDAVVVKVAVLRIPGKDDLLPQGEQGGGVVDEGIEFIVPDDIGHAPRGVKDDQYVGRNPCGYEKRAFAAVLS